MNIKLAISILLPLLAIAALPLTNELYLAGDSINSEINYYRSYNYPSNNTYMVNTSIAYTAKTVLSNTLTKAISIRLHEPSNAGMQTTNPVIRVKYWLNGNLRDSTTITRIFTKKYPILILKPGDSIQIDCSTFPLIEHDCIYFGVDYRINTEINNEWDEEFRMDTLSIPFTAWSKQFQLTNMIMKQTSNDQNK